MTLFSTKAEAPKRGPRAIWPWFFLSVACLSVIGFAALILSPWDYPSRDELVETGGDIKRFSVRDHLTDNPAVWDLSMVVSVYITFKDLDGEYEFPWSHPRYVHVRDRLGVQADILVRKSDLEGSGPYKIWALEEHNPYKPDEDQVVATYDEIIGALEQQAATLRSMTKWLGIAAAVFAAYGAYTIRWNRRNYPDWHQ